MHLFWIVVFGALVHAATGLPTGVLRALGTGLVIVAIATAAIVINTDLTGWLAGVSEEYRAVWFKRVGYTVATKTDLPMLQAFAAGVVCLWFAGRNQRSYTGVQQCHTN